MRKNLLILSFAAMAMAAQADVLSPEQALSRAMGNGPAKAPALGEAPTLVFTGFADNEPATYVFEKAQGGFLLLSADDAVAPVLGYSDNAFDENNIPDGLRYWMDMYAQEIAYARANGQSTTYKAPAYASAMPAIGPLCTTMWNQGAPYNDMCPKVSGGTARAVTGCVATAMAQVMKYHNYPEVGQGTASNSSAGMEPITLDYSKIKFDWTNMLNVYSNQSTQVQKDAVAQLMVACGVSVSMKYTTGASGTQSEYVAKALVNYFNYDEGCHFLDRDYFSMTEWKQLAYDELKNNGPILYSGQSNEGGHAFVVDGYDGNDYFHLNWGWGGVSDGYYLLSALNPESQGIGGYSPGAGFNTDQSMLLGVKKPVAGSQRIIQLGFRDSAFKISQSSVNLGSSFTVDNTTWNTSAWSAAGTLGVFITSSNGAKQFVGNQSFDIRSGAGGQIFGAGSYAVRLPNNLAAGTYTVTPAWKTTDGREFPLYVRINLCKSYTMTVSGTTATFKANTPAPQLKATALTPVSQKLYAQLPVSFRVTFNNPSAYEFYGSVAVGLWTGTPTSGTNPTYAGTTFLVDVAGGETIEMPVNTQFSRAPAGTYKLAFYNPDTKEILGNTFNVTFETAPTDADSKYTVTNFGFIDGNTVAVDPSNLSVHFTLECTEGFFNKTLYIIICKSNASYAEAYVQVPSFTLYPGESKTSQLFIDASTLPYSKRYSYRLYLSTQPSYSSAATLAGPVNFSIADPAGIGDIEADEVVEVKYYNLQGMPVDFEQAAPGVYVRVSVYADGTTSTDKVRK